MVLLGGDNRGPGSGGSATYIVNYGDNSCLSDQSPSSTPGSPAGGSYPTSTSGAGTGGGGGSSSGYAPCSMFVECSLTSTFLDITPTSVPSWVREEHFKVRRDPLTKLPLGGVIGGIVGLVALLLLILFFIRRHRFHKSQRPVDLLHENDGSNDNLPQYYRPEPFVVPEPSASSAVGGAPETREATETRPSVEHRGSHYSALTAEQAASLRSSTPDQSQSQSQGTSTYMRKSPAPPSFRPVNIVQHEDAGPSDDVPQPDLETIELPPAYTNIRPNVPPPPPAEDVPPAAAS